MKPLPQESETPAEICIDGVCALEPNQRWELINPEGIVKIEPLKLSKRLDTLRYRTVLLRWNGKPNGDVFLEHVAGLLAEQVEGIKIVKAWETVPESIEPISGSQDASMALARKLLDLKPDLVIGSHGD